MEKQQPAFQKHIFVCVNQREPGERVCCAERGAAEMREYLKAQVKARGLGKKVRVYNSGCQDQCEQGPNILIFPDNVWLKGVRKEDLDAILNQYVFQTKENEKC